MTGPAPTRMHKGPHALFHFLGKGVLWGRWGVIYGKFSVKFGVFCNCQWETNTRERLRWGLGAIGNEHIQQKLWC